MSVKIATIIGQKWYIGGAPASRLVGQVLLYRRLINGQLFVEPEHILSGPQIGSSFGYEIVVADFNGDGSVFINSCRPTTYFAKY